MSRETIRIKKDVRIPGTDIVVERGDSIIYNDSTKNNENDKKNQKERKK